MPQTPFARARTRTALASGGDLATVPGTDLRTLQDHVIDLGNDGRLSQSGKFTSWPGQIEGAFKHMDEMHTRWAAEGDAQRRVVLYAHGGVVSEADGLKIAQKQLGWWLNNHVYPLFFVWESGPLETVGDFLVDEIRKRMPLVGAGWDVWEGLDRSVEGISRETFWWMWDQMKENAAAASEPISPAKKAAIRWPPTSSTAIETMTGLPGASLLVDRLRRYRDKHPGLEVSMVGHSAGTIFLSALLARLAGAKLPVRSMSFMGAALRIDEFVTSVLPRIRDGTVGDFADFVLSDAQELDDKCNVGPLVFYHKSLPYLVARGFERPAEEGGREVGLVGMARFLAKPIGTRSRATLGQQIERAGGAVVVSPSSGQVGSNCTANGHGEFDEDKPTMTSVLHRILGHPGTEFEGERAARPLRGTGRRAACAADAAGGSRTPRNDPRHRRLLRPGGEAIQEGRPRTNRPERCPPGPRGSGLQDRCDRARKGLRQTRRPLVHGRVGHRYGKHGRRFRCRREVGYIAEQRPGPARDHRWRRTGAGRKCRADVQGADIPFFRRRDAPHRRLCTRWAAVFLTPGQSKPSRARRTRFVGASIGAFGIALVFGTWAAGNSAVAQQEPSIEVHLTMGEQ